ncbi:hypothetical protein SAMN03080617_01509 [Algoriphagus alkaliphilus]|uniref:Cas10/Cmr2 second palm domain-containing protein n=1 Tax=Algoriphagus alkaliphilus TaxID=279824 RepID=A0A1G5X1J6_9BACT|nr:hypothetical protein [Algoriphagus alkaliphilus]SDA64298.1 hypothetical protein SAMN03080617_01509 [Algoriphagus alkaliphilus]
MDRYLYGASIQGIQSFIFQTNKLKEIVGGSELVEEICTEMFYDFIGSDEYDENIILSAAGNIKYIADQEVCKKLIKGFTKKVLSKAPGVTVSQAVVKIDENIPLSETINQLEEKLKTERNKPNMPLEIGFMGLERARRTGGVAVEFKKRKSKLEAFCESTIKKDKAVDQKSDLTNESSHTRLFRKISGLTEKPKEITLEIEEICKGHSNSWIAVVHADGNGLGNILRVMGEKLKNSEFEKSKAAFRKFSLALDHATQAAAQSAFWKVFSKADAFTSDNKHPIRPIICGGDDITFIIRADLALEFTEFFLREFEKKTKDEFKVLEEFGITEFKEGITACAGIAYIKESYPLHYALNLSESLCKDAKNLVKEGHPKRDNGIPESALAFYKVQESFTDKLSILQERTLQAINEGKKLDYYFGPYLLNDLSKLQEKLSVLRKEADSQDGSKAISKIRKVVSDSFKDFSVASFNLERMKTVNEKFFKDINLQEDLEIFSRLASTDSGLITEKSQLLDLITLHGFRYGTRQN